MAEMNQGCQCAICKDGWSEYQKWELEMYERAGWFAHYVHSQEGEDVNPLHTGPMGVNFHTHGIPWKYGHPDLQIGFPCKPDTCHALFWNVVRRIEEGETFEPGDVVERIAGNGYYVKFVTAIEGENDSQRHVLRIILPDENNNVEEDAEHPYCHQYEDLKIFAEHDMWLPEKSAEFDLISNVDREKWQDFEAHTHPAQVRRSAESN